VLDDGLALTDKSGLVVFGNVEPPNSGGTQTVIVTRGTTGSGQFAVKVAEAAASIASVDVQF